MTRKTLGAMVLFTLVGCGSAPPDASESPTTTSEGLAGGILIRPNACGNSTAAPAIRGVTIVSPQALDSGGNAPQGFNPSAGRTVQGGIQYVSGGAMRLELVTDGCTYVNGVQLGSHVITPTYTGGYWYSLSDVQSDTTQHVMSLWVFFPGTADGATENLSVTVGRTFGAGTATYEVPVVHVKSVQATLVDAPVTISGTEIYNQFASSLYAQFNGAANSVVVNGRRLYGYDPSSLSAYIDNTGIWISFTFKADVADWCDPTVRVTGTFVLDTNAPGKLGLSVRWVNPIQSSMDWGWCGDLVDIPLLGAIPMVVYLAVGDDGAANSVQQKLTDQINQSLPSPSALFLDGTTTRPNELRVNLKIPAPSVEIAVPYDAFDMPPRLTRFPAGQPVTLIAAGLGMNDAVAGANPAATLDSGPAGVPLQTPASLPNAHTVARSGALVDSASPVGRLMAKTTDIRGFVTTYRYGSGCGMYPPNQTIVGGAPFIRFGVNDTAADAQRLRSIGASGYSLRVLFDVNDGACSSFGGNPVIGGGGAVGP